MTAFDRPINKGPKGLARLAARKAAMLPFLLAASAAAPATGPEHSSPPSVHPPAIAELDAIRSDLLLRSGREARDARSFLKLAQRWGNY
jgi:hypothetical protein